MKKLYLTKARQAAWLAGVAALWLTAVSPALAGQTINIDHAVDHDVYGNGDAANDGNLPVDEEDANDNTVNIGSNGIVTGSVTGGVSHTANASGNIVNINGGRVYGAVIGGETLNMREVTISNNVVTISDAKIDGEVYGGVFNDDVAANDYSKVSNNILTINNSSVLNGRLVFGGHSGSKFGFNEASNNAVIINNSTLDDVVGGSAGYYSATGSTNVSNNTVTINGGTIDTVVGGTSVSDSGAVTSSNNTVNISGGAVGAIAATSIVSNSEQTASNNTLNISGGTINSHAVAVAIDGLGTATVTDNIVNISGSPDLSTAVLAGVGIERERLPGDVTTGNTLNLKTADLTVAELSSFQNLNFYIPATLTTGATMLAVTGEADITDTTVNVGVEGTRSPLKVGDHVVLIDASAGELKGTPLNTSANGQGMQGVTLKYEFDLVVENNKLLANLTKAALNEQNKALSEGFISGIASVNQNIDLAAEQGIGAITDVRDQGKGKNIFAVLSGGASRYNTGSHVNVNSVALMAGIAGNKKLSGADLTLGAFLTYGKGNYNTFSSFDNAASVRGDGATDSAGGGILGRIDFNGTKKGHSYAEGSLQAGSVKTDFHSADLAGGSAQSAQYDTRSMYYGLHLGTGYVWNISDKATFDLYGKYLYSRRGSDDVTLSTGDPIHFDAIKSQRVRIGGRYTRTTGKAKAYAGLAWEREFGAEAKATAYDLAIDAPELKGNTGIAELGVTLQHSKAWTLDLSVQGYIGKREGVSARVSAEYKF